MSETGLLSTDNSASTEGGETGQTEQSTQTGDWKDGVSKELRYSKDGNDKLAKFTDQSSLATSYLELQNMDSGKVKIPAEDSTPEEKSAFYQKLGKPEKAEDYTLPELEEGQAYDSQLMDAVKAYAFDKNMSNEQLNGMVETYLSEARLAQDRQADATEDALKKDWGGDFDKNMEIGRRALNELAPPEILEGLKEELANLNLDHSENFVRFLNSIGSKMLDDTLVKGTQIETKDDYKPDYPNSPEMYSHGEDEDSVRGRAWHVKNGHIY